MNLTKTKQIFVVGSSRSGTTMMGRILDNHSEIFTFREMHFFGTLWTNSCNQELNKNEQINLLSSLFCIQEMGLFNQNNVNEFKNKSEKLLDKDLCNPLEIYELFLQIVSEEEKCNISCVQTPSNIYYLEEILNQLPNAKVINMIRDQRDVLLSQKNKWKRKFLGASAIPLVEAIRSFVNYHPILTAKVWNSSLEYTLKYKNHKRVKTVKFEELLTNSEEIVKDICSFLELDFHNKMLEVPVVGSSTEKDKKEEMNIDSSKVLRWKNGGLSGAEIFLSQKVSSTMLKEFNYPLKKFQYPPFLILYFLLIFPVKLGLAFLFNLHRMANIIEVIKKRFFVK